MNFFTFISHLVSLQSKQPLFFPMIHMTSIYSQRDLVPKTHQSLNFFIFLSILIFSYFLYFFENKQYQSRLNKENQWLYN